jgi:beta-glucosidase
MTEFMQFPQNFSWGTATAAFQIEGGAREDGRKDSIWDVFAHTPGKVTNGDNGDVADDHYHRWKEDIALMKTLGYKAYRFSLAWPRILPEGRGKVNQAGVDFYNRLIDELIKSDIKPLVTLYHWDLPAVLPEGWLNRETAFAFEEFTTVAVKAFGDRVKDWITINEPFCPSFLGYAYGRHAPGMRDLGKALLAAHHLLLAHGLAVPVIHAGCTGGRVGITLNEGPFYPVDRSPENLAAARHGDGEFNRWFLDPIFGRHYPVDMLQDYVKAGALKSIEPDFIHNGDMQKIAAPTDFLALNYYTRSLVKTGQPGGNFPNNFSTLSNPAETHTEMGWEIFPFGLYETICRAYFTYKPPEILITENGASYSDGPDSNGKVHDKRRIAYLQSHIEAVGKALHAGVPVTGYFVWSLMDNFEWAYGYAQRFGLIYVDYETQKRYPKDSATWYGQVAQKNGLEVQMISL